MRPFLLFGLLRKTCWTYKQALSKPDLQYRLHDLAQNQNILHAPIIQPYWNTSTPQLFISHFPQIKACCRAATSFGQQGKEGEREQPWDCSAATWFGSTYFAKKWESSLQPFSWICPMSWCTPTNTQELRFSRFWTFRGFLYRDLDWHLAYELLLQNNLIGCGISFWVNILLFQNERMHTQRKSEVIFHLNC